MLWNEEKKELMVVTHVLGLHINKKKGGGKKLQNNKKNIGRK
jgi:hypothetical protein